MKKRNVAILIFDDVEELDFCGPLEVFSMASDRGKYFEVYTVAEENKPIQAVNYLSVNPTYTIHNCPRPDIVIVPGGMGSRKEMHNSSILNWISSVSKEAELTLSVCTGALLLAKANLLHGLKITTHHHAFDILREVAPHDAQIVEGVRFVDNGQIILSAGVSAGIDMSLHVVSKLLGKKQADITASRMEYQWSELTENE